MEEPRLNAGGKGKNVTKPGLDMLISKEPEWLKKKRIGLLCHAASVNSGLKHASFLIAETFPGQLKAIFSPQHGLFGEKQANMRESADFIHPVLNIPVYSLYSNRRKPDREMLADIDVLLIDLQDVGVRVYTYIQTMILCMRACADTNVEVVVLDRPNPLGGLRVEGPVVGKEFRSFVGLTPICMRHGLTICEIAIMCRDILGIRCRMRTALMNGWERGMLWGDTGLHWVMPSPNIPHPSTCFAYAGQVVLEGTNISEGRGTTRPFEIFGAPYIDPWDLSSRLVSSEIEGVALREIFFEPTFDKWAGRTCGGLFIHILDPDLYRPLETAVAFIASIKELWPEEFRWRKPPYEYEMEKMPVDIIMGSDSLRKMLSEGLPASEIANSWKEHEENFEKLKKEFHLY